MPQQNLCPYLHDNTSDHDNFYMNMKHVPVTTHNTKKKSPLRGEGQNTYSHLIARPRPIMLSLFFQLCSFHYAFMLFFSSLDYALVYAFFMLRGCHRQVRRRPSPGGWKLAGGGVRGRAPEKILHKHNQKHLFSDF